MKENSTTQIIEDIAMEFYIPVSKARKLFRKEGKLWVTNDPQIMKIVEQSWERV